MTDAEYRKQKARISKLAKKWRDALGLRWWQITYEWERARDEPGFAQDENHWCALAKCKADWRYMRATIVFNMPEAAKCDDDFLESAIVHEFMHVFLDEMREWSDHPAGSAVSHEERVAETLTKAFGWVADAAKDGKL